MIRPFGERAMLVEVDGPDAARRLDAALRADLPAGVVGTVPGRASVLVEIDPGTADPLGVERAVAERLARSVAVTLVPPRRRTVPVVYGGEHGPDLAEVAALTGLPPAEVVDRHASADVVVLFLGFAPGFAYVGDLPEVLRVPRLDTPRTRTPAGSVAIAGAMTGIYPAALPGGWRVIGRTPISLFDARRDPPAYLAPGDAVRFVPIAPGEWDAHAGPAADW
jgi:KipI family sensor histidine kinase inhibitor